jgi:hypothetical protein
MKVINLTVNGREELLSHAIAINLSSFARLHGQREAQDSGDCKGTSRPNAAGK